MAKLRQAKSEEEIKKIGVAAVRQSYNELARDYNRIVDYDLLFCHGCGDFLKGNSSFYSDDRFVSGYFPICKRCVQKLVEQRKNDKEEPNETKESVQKVLRMMDLPYYDDLYENCIKGAEEGLKERNRKSPFSTYIVMVKSLPQYKGKKWADSEFEDEVIDVDEKINENSRIIKQAKKRFGSGYTPSDLLFLENEYQDWISRYECNTKAQESIFERLSFKKWEINKATRSGLPTKDLDKTYQELLATANIQPRQNGMDAFADAQTLGTLIQKYEETRPLPDIDPDLQDVDKIGLYIDAFYRGHASKMLGLKNAFSNIYERVMSRYTVKPPEYDDESDSEALFEKIFGSKDDA